MALILDKQYTGVTSVDISGNTLTTGYTNLDYTDDFGNVHDNPYLVIDDFMINKLEYIIRVVINIYKDSETRSNRNTPISIQFQNIEGDIELYNKYFSLENMENGNVFQAAYNFISEYYPSWKTDEV